MSLGAKLTYIATETATTAFEMSNLEIVKMKSFALGFLDWNLKEIMSYFKPAQLNILKMHSLLLTKKVVKHCLFGYFVTRISKNC